VSSKYQVHFLLSPFTSVCPDVCQWDACWRVPHTHTHCLTLTTWIKRIYWYQKSILHRRAWQNITKIYMGRTKHRRTVCSSRTASWEPLVYRFTGSLCCFSDDVRMHVLCTLKLRAEHRVALLLSADKSSRRPRFRRQLRSDEWRQHFSRQVQLFCHRRKTSE
jgi:hypothetical protein